MNIKKEAMTLIKELSSKDLNDSQALFDIKMLCDYLLQLEDYKEEYEDFAFCNSFSIDSLKKINRLYFKLNLFICSRKYHKYCNSCHDHKYCFYNLLHKNLFVSDNI